MSEPTSPQTPANPYGAGPQPAQPGAPAQPYGGAPAQPYAADAGFPQGTPAQPYGAPGVPGEQAGGQPPQFGGQFPPAVPQKKSGGKKVLSIVGAILAAVVVLGLKFGIGSLLSEEDKAAAAKVGDCIGELPTLAAGQEKEANAEVVKCDDASAKFSVVGRVDNRTEAQANSDEACAPFKEAEYVYLAPDDSSNGFYVLCLKPKTK